jgi:hypothetical protein
MTALPGGNPLPSLLLALFVVAHGLVHASFLSPAPPLKPGAPQWPFDLASSWALTPLGLDAPATRAVGIVLLVAVLAGYAVAALALTRIVPAAAFVPGIVAGSVASILMLGLFFHPWLVLGFVIDAALLWAVLAAGWLPGETAR